jgi:hypothetical protein
LFVESDVPEDLLIFDVEGPNGTAQIFEVTIESDGRTVEVQYDVVFGQERESFRSMGEAHVRANQLAGVA